MAPGRVPISRWPSPPSGPNPPEPRPVANGRPSAARDGRSRLPAGQRLRVVGLAGACGRVDRAARRLASGTPPGHPLLGVRPLVTDQDAGTATPAGASRAAGDPVVLAAPDLTGGALFGVVLVGHHQGAGAGDQAGQIRDVRDPGPGVDAGQEQRLDLVEVADPGEVPLVE